SKEAGRERPASRGTVAAIRPSAARGACHPRTTAEAGELLGRLDGLRQGRDHFLVVAHDAVTGELEDVGLWILVDGHDRLRARAAGHVLAGARNGDGDVEVRCDYLAGQPHLLARRVPAEV